MEQTEMTIDATNWEQKRECMRLLSVAQREVAALDRGWYRVTVEVGRYRRRRTDRQNKYDWPCFVKPLGDFLRAQGETNDDGNVITDQEVHEMYRLKFLRDVVVNRETGEALGVRVPSTTKLTTVQFNEYLDRIAHWLAEKVGIVVPPPAVYHEPLNADGDDAGDEHGEAAA